MAQENDTPFDDEMPSRGGAKPLVWLVVILVGLTAMGMVGQLAGAGFFGYRAWMYEGGILYVLNFEQEGLQVSIDGSSAKPVRYENAKMFDILGGTSEVALLDKQGKEIRKHEVTAKNSHVMLKAGDACVVVLDVSSYYRKTNKKSFKIVKRLTKKDQLYVPNSTNVIWPRNDLPQKFNPADGSLYWFEKVACDLLDKDEQHMLLAYMERKFVDRMNRQKQRKRGPVRQRL